MSEFVGYFSVAIIVIALAVFFRAARKEAQDLMFRSDRMNFVVRVPRIIRVLGIVSAAFFGACLTLSSFTAADDSAYPYFVMVFTGFFIIGGLMIFHSFRWKLIVAGDRLVLTPVFGKERVYSVHDVTHIKAGQTLGVRVYSDKKKLFSVGIISVGCAMLVSYLIEKGVRVPDRINLPYH